MMKRTLFVLAMLCVLSFNGYAILSIDHIEIVQAQDFRADYDHTTGKLEWRPDTDGTGAELYASATLRRSDGQEFIADALVHANFIDMTDSSSGGWASASFATVLDWDIIFFEAGVQVAKIEGIGIVGTPYLEEEGVEIAPGLRFFEDELYGSVVVNVEGGLTDFSHYDAMWADETGGEAKMESWMILPTGAGFADYDLQSYSTNLTTLWLDADETTIPEPMTMVLLGVGSVMMLRKRKA